MSSFLTVGESDLSLYTCQPCLSFCKLPIHILCPCVLLKLPVFSCFRRSSLYFNANALTVWMKKSFFPKHFSLNKKSFIQMKLNLPMFLSFMDFFFKLYQFASQVYNPSGVNVLHTESQGPLATFAYVVNFLRTIFSRIHPFLLL